MSKHDHSSRESIARVWFYQRPSVASLAKITREERKKDREGGGAIACIIIHGMTLKEDKISSEDHHLDYYRDLDFSPTIFSRLASTPSPMGWTFAVAYCASISARRSCLLVYRRWAEMI